MRREWIIDVLADLKAFAEHNGMDATAAGLEDASLVAIAEISSLDRPRTAFKAVVDAEVVPATRGRSAGNVTDIFAFRGPA